MLDNFVPAKRVANVFFEKAFDDGKNNGFGFPCDENGNLMEMSEAGRRNYEWCMNNPDKFVRFNKIIKYTNWYTQPAHGTCSCGCDVNLFDEYYGACECPECGKWYNMSGQELVSPEYWEEDFEPEETW